MSLLQKFSALIRRVRKALSSRRTIHSTSARAGVHSSHTSSPAQAWRPEHRQACGNLLCTASGRLLIERLELVAIDLFQRNAQEMRDAAYRSGEAHGFYSCVKYLRSLAYARGAVEQQPENEFQPEPVATHTGHSSEETASQGEPSFLAQWSP